MKIAPQKRTKKQHQKYAKIALKWDPKSIENLPRGALSSFAKTMVLLSKTQFFELWVALGTSKKQSKIALRI